MMNTLYLCLGSFLALFFSACATFSKEECQAMDWAAVGSEAAMSGQTRAQRLTYYEKNCGNEHGVSPDRKRFAGGYEKGLKSFCTAGSAHEFGTSGGTYQFTCPANQEPEFLKGYQLGKLEYTSGKVEELERTVDELRDELEQKNRRIEELESKLEKR